MVQATPSWWADEGPRVAKLGLFAYPPENVLITRETEGLYTVSELYNSTFEPCQKPSFLGLFIASSVRRIHSVDGAMQPRFSYLVLLLPPPSETFLYSCESSALLGWVEPVTPPIDPLLGPAGGFG